MSEFSKSENTWGILNAEMKREGWFCPVDCVGGLVHLEHTCCRTPRGFFWSALNSPAVSDVTILSGYQHFWPLFLVAATKSSCEKDTETKKKFQKRL